MEKRYKVIIWLVIVIGLASLIYYSINRPVVDFSASEKEALAKCLTAKGINLYTKTNCPGCVIQKNMFGDAEKFLIYINCDLKSNNCLTSTPLPYWMINGTVVRGPAPLSFIKDRVGC